MQMCIAILRQGTTEAAAKKKYAPLYIGQQISHTFQFRSRDMLHGTSNITTYLIGILHRKMTVELLAALRSVRVKRSKFAANRSTTESLPSCVVITIFCAVGFLFSDNLLGGCPSTNR